MEAESCGHGSFCGVPAAEACGGRGCRREPKGHGKVQSGQRAPQNAFSRSNLGAASGREAEGLPRVLEGDIRDVSI